MSCGQNDITKSPDHVNFVTLKIEKAVFLFTYVKILCPSLSDNRITIDWGILKCKRPSLQCRLSITFVQLVGEFENRGERNLSVEVKSNFFDSAYASVLYPRVLLD